MQGAVPSWFLTGRGRGVSPVGICGGCRSLAECADAGTGQQLALKEQGSFPQTQPCNAHSEMIMSSQVNVIGQAACFGDHARHLRTVNMQLIE